MRADLPGRLAGEVVRQVRLASPVGGPRHGPPTGSPSSSPLASIGGSCRDVARCRRPTPRLRPSWPGTAAPAGSAAERAGGVPERVGRCGETIVVSRRNGLSATHMTKPNSGSSTSASQPGIARRGSRISPRTRMVTAAPMPKMTALTSAAPTVRPIPMTRPRPAGNTPSTAKAGNIITASRTIRKEPEQQQRGHQQERQREDRGDGRQHGVADPGLGSLARAGTRRQRGRSP